MAVLASMTLGATLAPALASAEPIPSGGDFESTPSTWSWSGSAGALSSISAVRTGDASNHYLHTTYTALAGTDLAGLTAQETITSPTFTWSGATPQAITATLDRRASLGTLATVNGGVTINASLQNVLTGTSTSLLTNAVTTDSSAFQTVTSGPLAPTLLANGGQYRLVVTERVAPLVLLAGTATIDLDNVALDVTPAVAPAPTLASGSVAIGSITSTGATATATVDPGSSDTTVSVLYGTTTGYGSRVSTTVAANAGPTAVSLPISGLAPSTGYHAQIVATNATGPTASSDLTFTTASQPAGSTPPSVSASGVDGSPGERGATIGATLDAGGQGASYYVQYGTTGAYGSETAAQTVPVGTTGPGPVTVDVAQLSPGTAYRARLVAVGPGGTTYGSGLSFTTAAAAPPTAGVPTLATADDTGTSVTLDTSIDPGADDTQVSVGYGTTTAYGTTSPSETVGAGSGASDTRFLISGLTAGTTYHFQVTAANADGTVHSSDVAYTPTATPAPASPPTIDTASVTVRSPSGATVQTTVDPGTQSTTVYAEYGTTTGYGMRTPVVTIPGGSGPTTITLTLSGLSPATTYHVQLVTTSAAGTMRSADIAFGTPGYATTPAGTRPAPTTGTAGAACVAAYVSAPARTSRLLRLPAGAEVTAAHALVIALPRAGARLRIAGGATTRAGRRGFAVALSQLHIGHVTRVTVMLPRSGRRAARRVSLSIAASSCGAQVAARRLAGSRVAVTVRSALGARRVALTVPAGWSAPHALTLLGVAPTRSLRVLATGRRLRVRGGGPVHLARAGTTVTVSGLPAHVIGVTLVFAAHRAHGRLVARVRGRTGPVRTTRMTIRGRS